MLFAQTIDQVSALASKSDYSLVGVLVVAFAVCAIVGYRGAKTVAAWLAKEFLLPGRDKLFTHLDKTNLAMDGLNESMRTLRQVPERLERIEGKVDNLGERVDKIDDHLVQQDLFDRKPA